MLVRKPAEYAFGHTNLRRIEVDFMIQYQVAEFSGFHSGSHLYKNFNILFKKWHQHGSIFDHSWIFSIRTAFGPECYLASFRIFYRSSTSFSWSEMTSLRAHGFSNCCTALPSKSPDDTDSQCRPILMILWTPWKRKIATQLQIYKSQCVERSA